MSADPLFVLTVERSGGSFLWDAGRWVVFAQLWYQDQYGGLKVFVQGKEAHYFGRGSYASYSAFGPFADMDAVLQNRAVPERVKQRIRDLGGIG